MIDYWVQVKGVVEQGHGIASGRNPNSPYPTGSIELQTPFFKELGLDLAPYFRGTLNVSIRPYTFTLTNPQYTFCQVDWTPHHPPEDFSFSWVRLVYDGIEYDGWLYYPHPETKITHFQDPSILEIIAPLVPNITYGDKVEVILNRQEITINQPINKLTKD
jgi:hypothetical protein